MGRGDNRKPSIEREPRALSYDDLKYARESALHVINTRSDEEAYKIFTEGLEPVEHCAVAQNNQEDDSNKSVTLVYSRLKDIASAPF